MTLVLHVGDSCCSMVSVLHPSSFLIVAFTLLAISADAFAQGTYDIRRTDSNQSQYDSVDGIRTTRTQRQSGVVGRTRVDLDNENAQDMHTRIQWAGVGWGVTKSLIATAFYERDLGSFTTLRATGQFGFTDHDEGRELVWGGEVGIWFHTHRMEAVREYLLLRFSLDMDTQYGPAEDPNGDGIYHRSRTQRMSSSEEGVSVPGYRLRMIGAELGGGVWSGYHQTREESGSRFDRALIAYAFAGFASGWVKSMLYHVDGYGQIGRSRYHKVFAHLLYAPFVEWATLDVDESQQEPQFPVGLRVGVENHFGRAVALNTRVELMVIPAGGVGLLVFTLGFGSMFAS